ncbi:hypothetical protein AAC387_Pa11g1737 [Persea americana]
MVLVELTLYWIRCRAAEMPPAELQGRRPSRAELQPSCRGEDQAGPSSSRAAGEDQAGPSSSRAAGEDQAGRALVELPRHGRKNMPRRALAELPSLGGTLCEIKGNSA